MGGGGKLLIVGTSLFMGLVLRKTGGGCDGGDGGINAGGGGDHDFCR